MYVCMHIYIAITSIDVLSSKNQVLREYCSNY